MKYKLSACLLVAVAFLWAGSALITACASDDPPKMTKEELIRILDHPDVIVIDVRHTESWQDSDLIRSSP